MASLGTGEKSWLWLCTPVCTLQPGWVQPLAEAEYINMYKLFLYEDKMQFDRKNTVYQQETFSCNEPTYLCAQLNFLNSKFGLTMTDKKKLCETFTILLKNFL